MRIGAFQRPLPDDDAVTFLWTQESGPTVALEGADTARPTFTAPDLSTASVLVFTLMVSDAAGAMDTDTGTELGGAGEGLPRVVCSASRV